MKTINLTFTDEEHEKLFKKKNGLNWHDFVMLLLNISNDEIKVKGGKK